MVGCIGGPGTVGAAAGWQLEFGATAGLQLEFWATVGLQLEFGEGAAVGKQSILHCKMDCFPTAAPSPNSNCNPTVAQNSNCNPAVAPNSNCHPAAAPTVPGPPIRTKNKKSCVF